MELVDDAETMALDGGHRAGRPAMAGITELDDRRVYYYLLWPSTFLSIHPDYLLVHRLEPAGAGHTRIVCEWLFEPDDDRGARLRPVRCDRVLGPDQPPGLARLRAPAARHAVAQLDRRPLLEPGAERPRVRPDGASTATPTMGSGARRTVRSRYDVPPPKDDPAGSGRQGDVPAILLPRSAATAGARTGARARARRCAARAALEAARPRRRPSPVWLRLTQSLFWHGPAPVLRPPG